MCSPQARRAAPNNGLPRRRASRDSSSEYLIFDPAKFERSAAMRAVQLEQAETQRAIPKKDEVFAQQTHFGRSLLLCDECAEPDGPPIAPQHFAARCPASDAREQVVFLT